VLPRRAAARVDFDYGTARYRGVFSEYEHPMVVDDFAIAGELARTES
jgi:hypothetical protein